MQHARSDYRTSSFRFACDLYNLLPNPATLPCGKPSTWLLELGTGPAQSDPPGKGGEYTVFAEFTLWDAKTNTSAETHYTHRLNGYGPMTLAPPTNPRSPKATTPQESKLLSEASKSFDLGFAIPTAIISTFADASIPGYFTTSPSSSRRQSTSSPVASTSPSHYSPVAPHTTLVHDRCLADLLKYHGTNSQMPVICAHCRMLGVGNSGKLDDDFSMLWRCSLCGTAWYCSRWCQRMNWADEHKWDCAEGKGKEVKLRK